MAVPIGAVVGGLEVFKKVSTLFKKKRPGDKKQSVVEDAIGVLEEFGNVAATDPEAAQIMKDHALEMEREYSKQVASAMQVMNTEAASSDAVVRRARPTLMYIGYLILLAQLIIFPLASIKLTDFIDKEIVYWFYWMFSSGYLGYGVLRTVDKGKPGAGGLSSVAGNLFSKI
jgi:hypothetical protein